MMRAALYYALKAFPHELAEIAAFEAWPINFAQDVCYIGSRIKGVSSRIK